MDDILTLSAAKHPHLMGFVVASVCIGIIINLLLQIYFLKNRETLLLLAVSIIKGQDIPAGMKKKMKHSKARKSSTNKSKSEKPKQPKSKKKKLDIEAEPIPDNASMEDGNVPLKNQLYLDFEVPEDDEDDDERL